MTTTAKPPASPQEYVGEEMTLVEHLQELRSRLFKSALAVAVAFVVGFVLYQPVFDILKKPYCQLPEELRPASQLFDADRCVLVFNDVLGGFSIAVRAALVVTVIFAGPILFYQLFKFVVPGLRPVEKRFAVPFFVLSQALFAAGAVFAYFIIPRGLEFLLGFQPDAIPLLTAPQYLSFLINTMIAFGVSFEFPLILAILVLMGVIGTQSLGKYRRHAFFGTFVLAAVITPTQDPLTMLIMAGPLIVFYELVIVFSRVVARGRARRDAEAQALDA
jgi:sec-independent protein translocase protein TatC